MTVELSDRIQTLRDNNNNLFGFCHRIVSCHYFTTALLFWVTSPAELLVVDLWSASIWVSGFRAVFSGKGASCERAAVSEPGRANPLISDLLLLPSLCALVPQTEPFAPESLERFCRMHTVFSSLPGKRR